MLRSSSKLMGALALGGAFLLVPGDARAADPPADSPAAPSTGSLAVPPAETSVGESPRVVAPLLLDDVLRSVAVTHPVLEQAERKAEQADAKAFAARGGFDPVLAIRSKWTPIGYYDNGQADATLVQPTPIWGVALFAGYRIGWGTYPIYKGELETLDFGEVRAGVEVPIWKDGPIDSRRAKIRQTKFEAQSADRLQDATALDLSREASYAYWTWVADGQNLAIARELLGIAERRVAGLAEQADAGAIEPIVLVDNRRLVLERQAKVVAAKQKFAKSSLELSLYLRDDELRPILVGEERVPPVFPEPRRPDIDSLEAEVDRALERRPDFAALEAERQAALVGLSLARNQRAPDISLQTFASKDFGPGPQELEPTEWGVGAIFEMPLPLRQARGEFRAAKAAVAAIDAKRRALRDKIAAEIGKAYVALVAARQSVTLAREQVAVADQLAEAERTKLREGVSDLVIVNLREIAAADAATAENEALAEFQRSRADFLVATGRPPG